MDAGRDRDAAWSFQRLSRTHVTAAELAEFRAWRHKPLNRAAYGRLERKAERLTSYIQNPELLAVFVTAGGDATS